MYSSSATHGEVVRGAATQIWPRCFYWHAWLGLYVFSSSPEAGEIAAGETPRACFEGRLQVEMCVQCTTAVYTAG